MSHIWEACAPHVRPGRVAGTCWRMVENQEEIATRHLVSALDEQAVLEELLEVSKPERLDDGGLHYLLATPFRYPPLQHGSRFGDAFEPSLFYAAIDHSSLMAESSYYRFLFRAGLEQPFDEPVATTHTAFSVRFATDRGIALENPPFAAFEAELRSPTDYRACQALGTRMRDEGVEAFSYRSARDPAQGRNVGLFTPNALACGQPEQQVTWHCEATATRCVWRERAAHTVLQFPLECFLVDGQLPSPAA